jgi:citrate lyase subunit beta/citryl-CoA lyase
MAEIKVLRSILFVPVTKPEFLEPAINCRPDGIMLDLEDSVPYDRKAEARELIKESIHSLKKVGGIDVVVRINNDVKNLIKDLDSCVWPGLDGIMIPKLESDTEVILADKLIGQWEKERDLQGASIYFILALETTKGIINAHSIISSSPRAISVGLGAEDYCLDLGVIPSAEGTEILYAFSKMVTLAKAMGIQATGILGTITDVQDLEGFEQKATSAKKLGSSGSPCVHPKQVKILNRVFSPSQETVDWAKRVIEAFERALQEGVAALMLDGKMIDYPVYGRAKAIIDLVESIEKKELKKTEAQFLNNG